MPKTLTRCARSQDPKALHFCPCAVVRQQEGMKSMTLLKSAEHPTVSCFHTKNYFGVHLGRWSKMPHNTGTREADLAMWCIGTAWSRVVKSHRQFTEERSTQRTWWVVHSSATRQGHQHTSLLWVVRTLCRPSFEEWAHYFASICCTRQRGRIWLLSKHGPGSLGKDPGDFSQQSASLPELELCPIMMDFK